MMLTLDNLANRYHCLPSEALARATTLDLHVLDISARYNLRQNDIAQGRAPSTPQLSQEQMRAMLDQVREKNHA